MSVEVWKKNPGRQHRSFVNKAALRVFRDAAAFRLGINAIERALRLHEHELGRELLLSEVETLCERFGFEEVVAFIRRQES